MIQSTNAADCASELRYGKPFSEEFYQGYNSCFYLGLGAGASRKVPEVENDFGYGRGDDIDAAGQLYFGYRLNQLWFIELGYTSLGKTEFISRADIAMDDPLIEYSYESFVAYAGRYLIEDKNYGWNIFARAGYAHTRADSDNEARLFSGSADNFMFGGGIDFRPKKSSWFIRGSADYYEDDVQVATLSVGRYLGLNIMGFGKRESVESEQLLQSVAEVNENASEISNAEEVLPSEKVMLEDEGSSLLPQQRDKDCELLDKVADEIIFAPTSSELAVSSMLALEVYAKALIRNTDLLVEVAAHTSATGSPSTELELTTTQAEAVTEYLISLGVSEGQLITRGYGAKRPITTGESANEQARNRRVAFRIMNVAACFK